MLIIRVILFLAGTAIVLTALASAVRTFVLPRGVTDRTARRVFQVMRALFMLLTRGRRLYAERDALWALFGPVSLLALLVVWMLQVYVGSTLVFWSMGTDNWRNALTSSGSSILTLGFSVPTNAPQTGLVFADALLGLILIALFIAYLPTIYNAWSKREAAVTLLEVRAGNPPTAAEMLIRFHQLDRMDKLSELWEQWEMWFADIEETHTSFASLVHFRSSQPDHSWVTAAGAVLDAAAMLYSTLDIHDPQAALTIRAGYLSLQRICAFFHLPYDPHPSPDAPISVSQVEFNAAYDKMAAAGVPLVSDRERAWQDWRGWRVNYDRPLLLLAALTIAPPAPWSSDRTLAI